MAKKHFIFIFTLLLFFAPYCYSQSCTGSLGNPITNVTFGQGTNPGSPLSVLVPGASTTYIYVAPGGSPPANIVLDGDYALVNGVPSNPYWLQGGDHTGNANGYMAFFNAAPTPGEFYRQSISGLCPGTTYEFAAWILNAIRASGMPSAVPPNVTFNIYDPGNLSTPIATFSTGNIPAANTIIWHRYATLFTTPAGLNNVLLTLNNNNVGGTSLEGNDLAIDDITFSACGPLTTASFSATAAITSLSICNAVPFTLYGTISSGLNNPAYQWQMSSDNGSTWNDIAGATSLNYTIPGSAAGTYLFRLVSGEVANSGSPFCKFYSNLIQINVSLLAVNAGVDTSFCTNNAVTHILHGNTTGPGYTWQPAALLNNNTLQNPTATVASTTTFYLTTSNASCTAIDSVKITVNPLPVVSTINDFSICKRDSILLTTLGNATTFQWTPPLSVNNPGISNPYFIDTISQQLIVTGTIPATGCFSKDTVNITIKPIPTVQTIPDTSLCGAHNVILNTTGAPTYSWTPAAGLSNAGIFNPVFSGSNTQTYIVTGTAANACKAKDTVTITVNPQPVVTTINNITICRGDLLQLITNTNAQNNHWTPVLSLDDPNIANPYFTDTVTQQMIITGTNSTGCIAKDTVTVTVKTLPTIHTIADTALCGAHNVTLTTTGGQSYLWLPATGLSNPAIANPIFTGTNTQTYTVTGTGANACKAKDTVSITINAIPLVSTINNISICRGDLLQLTTNSNAQTNHWTPALSVNNPNTANPNFTDTVTQQMIITGTNSSTGCFSSDTVTVTVKPLPHVITIDDFTSCAVNTIILSTTGAQSYSWSPATNLDDPTNANPIFTGTAGTYTYYVSGTGGNGCIAKDTVDITISTKPVFIAPVNKTVCATQSIELDGNNGTTYQYQWTPATYLSNNSIVNPTANPTITTTYTLLITDHVCNYDSTFSVMVTVNPLPSVHAEKSNDMDCAVSESHLTASGASQYNWNPATGLNNNTVYNPIAAPYVTTQYIVSGTDNNGCNKTDTVTVYVKGSKYFGFNVPNSFTPNGDGLNECFGVTKWGETKNFTLIIYDRLGKKVFESHASTECWDGTYKGQPADVGNYVYYLTAETLCGNVTRKGNVLLIR